jgi:hypothetical protein
MSGWHFLDPVRNLIMSGWHFLDPVRNLIMSGWHFLDPVRNLIMSGWQFLGHVRNVTVVRSRIWIGFPEMTRNDENVTQMGKCQEMTRNDPKRSFLGFRHFPVSGAWNLGFPRNGHFWCLGPFRKPCHFLGFRHNSKLTFPGTGAESSTQNGRIVVKQETA